MEDKILKQFESGNYLALCVHDVETIIGDKIRVIFTKNSYYSVIGINFNFGEPKIMISVVSGCTLTKEINKFIPIHKKHEAVLNAWLLDNDVEIEIESYSNVWSLEDSFINGYSENFGYRLKEKKMDLNNCYCEATEENYKRLIESKLELIVKLNYALKYDSYFFIEDNKVDWAHNNSIGKMQDNPANEGMKEIHLINNEWQSKEKKMEDKELRQYIKEAVNSSHPVKEVTSIIAMVKEEYKYDELLIYGTNEREEKEQKVKEFSKWGFLEPEYDYEILKQGEEFIVVFNKDNNDVFMIMLNSGNVYCDTETLISDYALTPIKKEWHDDINNFPALTYCKNSECFEIILCKDGNILSNGSGDCFHLDNIKFIESLKDKLSE